MNLAQISSTINSDISKNNYLKWAFILICSLVFVRWMYIIDRYSVNVLFYDHWDLYIPLFNKSSLWELYNWQHGPHRQGLGFILTKYIDQLSGWNTKWISYTIGILLAASSATYFLVKKRLTGKLTLLDVIIPVLILTPSQFGVFANTPNISHGAMPVFLISVFCLSLFVENEITKVSLMVILNFLIIYSGFGLLFGLICPFIFLLLIYYNYTERKSAIYYIIGLVVASLSLVLFFNGYGHAPANPNFQFPHDKPLEYIIFMAKMTKTAIGIPKGVGDVIAYAILFFQFYVIITIVVQLLKKNTENYITNLIIISIIGFAILFEFATAVGRVSFGVHVASASRYAPYVIPGLIGLYFYCINKFNVNIIHSVFLLIFMIFGFWGKYSFSKMKTFKESKETWVKIYKETNNIGIANSKCFFPIYPDPSKNKILKKRLNYLKKNKLSFFNND